MCATSSIPLLRTADAARRLAGKEAQLNIEISLSMRGAKKGFATPARSRNIVWHPHLALHEFSPARRQLCRVKTPCTQLRSSGSVMATIFPLVVGDAGHLETRPLQDLVDLATLTRYRGSIPVASSRATCNGSVAHCGGPKLPTGKKAALGSLLINLPERR